MLRLREIEKRDIEIINAWRSDKALIDKLGEPFRYINSAVDEQWFDNYMKNRSQTVRCAIVNEDDAIIGLINLYSLNSINQSAVLSIMIGNKEYRGKGVGTFAVNEMLNHAFNNLNLNRVELTVLKSNEVAQRLYEKSGFVKEGTIRQCCYKNGRFEDMYLYSVLKDEWNSK